jgi:hypothetical protein
MPRLLGVLAGVLVLAGCGDDPPLEVASGADRRGMERAVDGWFTALAEGDAKAACSHLTSDAQDQIASEGGGDSCEEVIERLSDLLFLELRQEIEAAHVSVAFVRGDSGDVELDGPSDFAGPWLLHSLRLERAEGTWKISGVSSPPIDPSPLFECKAGGMRAFEKGDVDPVWRRVGRPDYREYITRFCELANDRGLLDEASASRAELQRVAEHVLRQMIRSGRIAGGRG